MSNIVKRLSALFGVGKSRYLAGTDLSQNKYYEYPSRDGDPDPRKTRRMVRFRVHKELGEYDQSTLPTQWLMWLRHTRKSAPSIEELVQDQERIAITQHNARVLELKEEQRRMELEAKAQQETRERQLIQQESYDKHGSGPPTSTVEDRGVKDEARERIGTTAIGGAVHEQRKVDMEVWEASRQRLQRQDEQRARHSEDDSHAIDERQRARQIMQQSPLSAFDVSYVDEEAPSAAPTPAPRPAAPRSPSSGLNPRFGRAVGPGEDWKPDTWQPAQPAKRGA